MMKILITGAAGFVGSALVRRMLERGDYVVGVDALTDYYDPSVKEGNLAGVLNHPKFEFVKADLNEVDLFSLVEDVEVVFHEAGQPGVRKSWGSDFGRYLTDNVAATQRLLEALKGSTALKRFVYASSSSVYGEAARYPTREDDRPQPMSPYGVSKLAAEHLVTLYGRNHGLPTVSLRYFTVYGPGQRPDMAFHRFIRAALTDEPITVFGTGEQIRDFTFVDDVVDANLRAANGAGAPGEVFNVAGGSNTTVNEVLGLLETLHGREIRRLEKEPVPGDVFQTGGATERIGEALGWVPRVSLAEGLAAEYEWMRSIHAS